MTQSANERQVPHATLDCGAWRHPAPRLRAALVVALLAFAGGIACWPAPSASKDRNADNAMKDFARQQRQEEQRRQNEAARRAAQQTRSTPAQTQTPSSAASKSNATSTNNGAKATENGKTQSNKDAADKSARDDGKDQLHDAKTEEANDDGGGDRNEPPATLQQWFKRLAAPQPVIAPTPNHAAQETPPAPNRTLQKVLPSVPAAVAKAPAVEKTRRAVGGTPSAIAFPELARPEVLAINATAANVARVKGIGFTALPTTALSSLSFSVTRLLPPAGVSLSDAQALLQNAAPDLSFAPNLTYRIYKTAGNIETQPSGLPSAAAEDGGRPCAGDRCFAQSVIGWTPELRTCATDIKIGIIDTSVDVKHPALARKRIELRHFASHDKRSADWHGTGVTALLAGDSNSSTPGLIPDASFYVADIFYAGDNDSPQSDTLSMLRAFNWLDAKGVKIINLSLSGPPDQLIEQAVAKLAAKGIVLVAAAGNDGPNNDAPSYPAAYDDVIAVTAVNRNLQNYRYANRGAFIDVAAPGVGIWTALPGGRQGYHSGTSFATPYVTASLAALHARTNERAPGSAIQMLTLRDLGDAGPDAIYGGGLLVAPTSCANAQIAKAPTGPKRATNAWSAGVPAAAGTPSAASVAEELPWLSFSGGRN